MRGGVSLQCCGEQARPGGGAGGGRNAAAWNPASFPNAPAHGGVYSACSCNCRTCMRHATSGEEQTPGAAACVKRLLQRSAWHAPAPGPRRCARRPRQAPRAARPDPLPARRAPGVHAGVPARPPGAHAVPADAVRAPGGAARAAAAPARAGGGAGAGRGRAAGVRQPARAEPYAGAVVRRAPRGWLSHTGRRSGMRAQAPLLADGEADWVPGRLHCVTACAKVHAGALVTHVRRVEKRVPPNHPGRRFSNMHKVAWLAHVACRGVCVHSLPP